MSRTCNTEVPTLSSAECESHYYNERKSRRNRMRESVPNWHRGDLSLLK